MSDVGEIVGRLRIDEGNWYRELDRAQEKADGLGRSNPRVTVTASTREAVRELDAAARTAEALGAKSPTVRARADTAGAQRQIELLSKYTVMAMNAQDGLRRSVRDASQATAAAAAVHSRLGASEKDTARAAAALAAAEETLQRAVVGVRDDAVQAAAGLGALEEAHEDAARAAVEHAAAEETVEGAIDRVSRRADSGAGRIAIWTAAIAAAIPPLIPIAGVAAGGAVALGALGAAGILAGTGIARGAKTGQGAYAAYKPLITQVLDDVHQLQDTAAAGLLPGAERSVSILGQKMPVLTRGVDEFATRLGDMAPTGLSAVINLVERGAPLWRAGADWIGRMVSGLDDFSRSTAFQGFIDYSVRNLPKVERFLSEVVELAGRILEAWAPLGEVALPVLTDLVSGVGDIVSATGPLIPAIGGVYLAFRAWTGIRGIIDGINVGLDLMAGRAGTAGRAVVAAEGAGSLLGGIGGGKAGKVGRAASGASRAGRLGGAVKGIAGGALGGVGMGPIGILAAATVGSIIANSGNPLPKNPVTTPGSWNAGVVPKGNSGRGAVLPTGTTASGSWTGYAPAAKAASAANLEFAASGAVAAAAIGRTGQAVRLGAAAMHLQRFAADDLAASQRVAASTAQGLEGANVSARDAIAGVDAAARANGHSLSMNTEKGRANRAAFLGMAQGITAYGDQVTKATGSADRGKHAMDGLVVSLVKQATAAGYSKTEISGYIAKLLGIPKKSVTELLAIDRATPKAKQAAETARTFSVSKYEAVLRANGVPAKTATRLALAEAEKWGRAHPRAILDASNRPALTAIAKARAELNGLNGKVATVYIKAVQQGGLNVSAARLKSDSNRAYGGTIGDRPNSVSSMLSGIPRNAWGTTVRGAGSAATDSSLSWVSRGEEIVSNLFGQADQNRAMLKAINSGDRAKMRRVAEEEYGTGSQRPTQVIYRTIAPEIHIHNPVAVDPVAQASEVRSSRWRPPGSADVPAACLPAFTDPPLELTYQGTTFRIPPVGIAAGVQLWLLYESGDPSRAAAGPLALGTADAAMRAANVPAGFYARARDAALSDFYDSRDDAEQVWLLGAEAAAAAPRKQLRGLESMDEYGRGEKDPDTGLYEWYEDLPPEASATDQNATRFSWTAVFADWDTVEHAFAAIGIDLETEWERRTWRWFRARIRGLLATDTILAARFQPQPAAPTKAAAVSAPDD